MEISFINKIDNVNLLRDYGDYTIIENLDKDGGYLFSLTSESFKMLEKKEWIIATSPRGFCTYSKLNQQYKVYSGEGKEILDFLGGQFRGQCYIVNDRVIYTILDTELNKEWREFNIKTKEMISRNDLNDKYLRVSGFSPIFVGKYGIFYLDGELVFTNPLNFSEIICSIKLNFFIKDSQFNRARFQFYSLNDELILISYDNHLILWNVKLNNKVFYTANLAYVNYDPHTEKMYVINLKSKVLFCIDKLGKFYEVTEIPSVLHSHLGTAHNIRISREILFLSSPMFFCILLDLKNMKISKILEQDLLTTSSPSYLQPFSNGFLAIKHGGHLRNSMFIYKLIFDM